MKDKVTKFLIHYSFRCQKIKFKKICLKNLLRVKRMMVLEQMFGL